ncbi:MAG: hypothetical protein IJ223_00700 [Clostridia bacterium]|nr:hypothetical protein [Clostridia bacterium]
MGILRFIGKLFSTALWAIFMPFFAIGRWTRDIFYGIIMLRLFKNIRGSVFFVVAIVIPLFVYGTMNQMKINASQRLESNMDYVLKNEWKGTSINARVPSGAIGFVFTKSEAMKIAKKVESKYNYRAKARHDNRNLGFYVAPNIVYDQFITVDWEGGYIRIKNKE